MSARTPEEARRATADGADYLGVGPVYTSKTKMVRAPGGPELIARMREATKLPIVGIAGIGPGNAGPVIAAGADGVAVISAVLDAADPVEVARALLEEVARAKRGRAKSTVGWRPLVVAPRSSAPSRRFPGRSPQVLVLRSSTPVLPCLFTLSGLHPTFSPTHPRRAPRPGRLAFRRCCIGPYSIAASSTRWASESRPAS